MNEKIIKQLKFMNKISKVIILMITQIIKLIIKIVEILNQLIINIKNNQWLEKSKKKLIIQKIIKIFFDNL